MITLLLLINLSRLTPLTESPYLTELATTRATEMCDKGQWSHDGFRELSHKIFAETDANRVGENLAKGFTDDSSMVNAWLNSPSHKKIMLDERYKKVGVGRGWCGIVVNLFTGN